MKYKHFYWAVLLRLAAMILSVTAAVYFMLVNPNIALAAVAFFLLVLSVINVVLYFNRLNKWTALFLLGIENEDTTLKIPSGSGNKTIDEVYRGMRRLNELFRQTKMEIDTREQYFRQVINQSATGLFTVNEKGRIIHINPEAVKLVGLNEYHHINALKNIDTVLPDLIMQQTAGTHPVSVIFENSYGQKLLFKISQMTIQNKKIKLIAVGDITKELDNREVDAWIKLARTLSHEIMNNIAPITSLTQVILRYFLKDGKPVAVDAVKPQTIANTVKGLQVIEERGLGLMHFVDHYRKFTKLPEPHLKETDLSALLESNLLTVVAFPGFDKITVKKYVLENIFCVTDEKLLSQVITNLLKNAVEALGTDGVADPVLVVRLWKTDHQVKIVLENNGPAIPPEIREQIFVPFFTTKETGSGVGLSLSKQIMLSMGGDILLHPSKEGWTSFIVVLNGSVSV